MGCRKPIERGTHMDLKSNHTKNSSILAFFVNIFCVILFISRSEYFLTIILLLSSVIMFSVYIELKTEKSLNKYYNNARNILYYIIFILVILYVIYLYSLFV